jgi:hypothetical protein
MIIKIYDRVGVKVKSLFKMCPIRNTEIGN